MKQQTFAAGNSERYRKPTRRQHFHAEMDKVVPWGQLCALIKPDYPKTGTGRPPVGLERMLRIYFLQHGFNLSDPGAEGALYESRSMSRYAGIDLGREQVPDDSAILGFRHLLDRHQLGEALFQAVGEYLCAQGQRITSSTIVDVSIISAPSSAKNRDKSRNPEMRSTRKGNQWYFGMKAHIGVDGKIKQINAVTATVPNCMIPGCWKICCTGGETRVWRDAACAGQTETMRQAAPCAQDYTQEKCAHNRPVDDAAKARTRTKSKVRAKVEHVFAVIKRVFCLTRCDTVAWSRLPIPCSCCAQ